MEPRLNFSQQDNLFDPAYAEPVTVIGAGSVGSHVVTQLAKIGVPKIAVYDGDDVASHNLPMSRYRIKDLGKPKVQALAEIVAEESGLEIERLPVMYKGSSLRYAVVACPDNMEARKAVWDAVRMDPLVDILVDVRVANEFVSVFTISPCEPEDIEYYEHFLYPSTEALPTFCGQHGVAYVSALAAALVCTQLTDWWNSGTKERHRKTLLREIGSPDPAPSPTAPEQEEDDVPEE